MATEEITDIVSQFKAGWVQLTHSWGGKSGSTLILFQTPEDVDRMIAWKDGDAQAIVKWLSLSAQQLKDSAK